MTASRCVSQVTSARARDFQNNKQIKQTTSVDTAKMARYLAVSMGSRQCRVRTYNLSLVRLRHKLYLTLSEVYVELSQQKLNTFYLHQHFLPFEQSAFVQRTRRIYLVHRTVGKQQSLYLLTCPCLC